MLIAKRRELLVSPVGFYFLKPYASRKLLVLTERRLCILDQIRQVVFVVKCLPSIDLMLNSSFPLKGLWLHFQWALLLSTIVDVVKEGLST